MNAASSCFSRRRFLLSATASLAATRAWGMRGGAGTATRYPLEIPPLYATNETLLAAPAIADLGGGRTTTVLAYDAYFPGPTFRANSGGSVAVTLQNGLADETTIHWHGFVVPSSEDGQPQDAILPGNSYTYQFPIVQRAALNWYHPHPHGMTGEQVALGLAGAFIVNDAEEAALGLPSGKYEVPLIVRDASYDKAGNLIYNPTSSGFMGRTPLVNGTRDPKLDVDRAVYRLRVLNGATARVMQLALSTGAPFTLIGNDGGLLDRAYPVGAIDISPGERLDLLVDFRGLAAGTRLMLRDNRAGWDLLAFDVTATYVENAPLLPPILSSIAALGAPVRLRTFTFDGMTRINGRVFDPHRIDFTVPLGETERWRFSTGGNAPHPVHVHGASFQVVQRTGGRNRVFPWETGWKDTVLLADKETVDVDIRFDGYRGRYMIHCHKLEHEDQGMMANFVVV